jgi:hypothetical protein
MIRYWKRLPQDIKGFIIGMTAIITILILLSLSSCKPEPEPEPEKRYHPLEKHP